METLKLSPVIAIIGSLWCIPGIGNAQGNQLSVSLLSSYSSTQVLKTSNGNPLQLARRGGGRGGAGANRGPATRPAARPAARPATRAAVQHRPAKAARHVRYHTVNGRRMRLYAAGAGIVLVAGAACYIDNYGNGQISGSQCCIGSNCYTNFYVD